MVRGGQRAESSSGAVLCSRPNPQVLALLVGYRLQAAKERKERQSAVAMQPTSQSRGAEGGANQPLRGSS